MSSAPLSATELAGMIDHTLLTPEATHNDVAKLVADAKIWDVVGVRIAIDAAVEPRHG